MTGPNMTQHSVPAAEAREDVKVFEGEDINF